MKGGATISQCQRYRYDLTRDWDEAAGRVMFVMLNPSVADATQDDPTIRRCVGFARQWGYGGLLVANLFALRATDPREVYKADDPVGPEADARLLLAAGHAKLIVCAWGTHGRHRGRDAEVLQLLRTARLTPRHLGLTKDGQPRHPLYLAAATELADFPEVVTVGEGGNR